MRRHVSLLRFVETPMNTTNGSSASMATLEQLGMVSQAQLALISGSNSTTGQNGAASMTDVSTSLSDTSGHECSKVLNPISIIVPPNSGSNQPTSPVAPPGTIYCAVYSGVPVYECIVRDVAVMRRRPDSYLNATQILKVAGLEKGKRTKIIEKEVLTGEHEKVQGGYGKYQGTWVPYERGKELAEQYGVMEILRPIIEYKPPRPDGLTSSYTTYTPTKEQAIEIEAKAQAIREQVAKGQAMKEQMEREQVYQEQEKGKTLREQLVNDLEFEAEDREKKEREDIEREAKKRAAREQETIKREFKEREQRERETKEREQKEQETNERESQEQEQKEPETRECEVKERGQKECEAREREQKELTAKAGPKKEREAREREEKQREIKEHEAKRREVQEREAKEREIQQSEVREREIKEREARERKSKDHHYMPKQSKVHKHLMPHPRPITGNSISKPHRASSEQSKQILVPMDISENKIERHRNVLMAIFLHDDPNQVPDLLTNPKAPSDFEIDLVIDSQGHTALHWAAALARPQVLELLLTKGANVQQTNFEGESALIRAVLVTNNYDSQTFPIILDLLHETITLTDHDNRTVFHHIAMTSGTKGHAAAAEYYMDCLVQWIVQNADGNLSSILNYQDKNGDTALSLATRTGNLKVVQQLEEMGANCSIENRIGLKAHDYGPFEDVNISTMSENSIKLNEEAFNYSVTTIDSETHPRKRSREVIAALQKIVDDTEEDYIDQLKQKEDLIADTRRQLNVRHRHLNEAGRKIQFYRQQEKELDEAEQSVRNLEQALQEEQNNENNSRKRPRPENPNGIHPNYLINSSSTGFVRKSPRLVDTSILELAVPARTEITLSAPMKTSAGMATSLQLPSISGRKSVMNHGAVGPRLIRATMTESSIPATEFDTLSNEFKQLQAQIAAYAKEEVELEEEIEKLTLKTSESEERYRRMIASCCQISPEEVDDLVEILVEAVESDGSELDLDRVRSLMNRNEEVVQLEELGI
ncbi:hypothetical protein G9A89_015157 [Geosiphon pyriformis]|nr:hypothetical protein G9A89_015157 [Geosiphon pyriformis]